MTIKNIMGLKERLRVESHPAIEINMRDLGYKPKILTFLKIIYGTKSYSEMFYVKELKAFGWILIKAIIHMLHLVLHYLTELVV